MANKPGNRNMKFKNRIQTAGVKKRLGNRVATKGRVEDARQKIMQKRRKKVFDARDVLAKMAKTQDARSKILKIRETKKGENVVNSSVRAIGSSILQKTDRNGKISLVTSKNKQSTSDMNLAIQQQLGLIPALRKKINMKRSPPMNLVSMKAVQRNYTPPVIRKTIVNDIEYHPTPVQPSYDDFVREYVQPENMYRWIRPGSRMTAAQMMDSSFEPRRPKSLTVAPRTHVLDNVRGDWRSYAAPSNRASRMPSVYIDLDEPEDEEMPLVSPIKQTITFQSPPRSSNILSRLDRNPQPQQSHGIFAAQTKTKVVVPAGHRIVVSNLQSTVTQDDIRELFEDIGQLLVARLVRPGTAEVIYKNLKDAQKAVDTYHNRQLDGQPMKCLLVNKRPINNPTGPAVSAIRSDSAGILAAVKKTTPVSKASPDKLVPDISTIHKVLFQRN